MSSLIFYEHKNPQNAFSQAILSSTISMLESLPLEYFQGCSREMRRMIMDELSLIGWSDSVDVVEGTKITISSYNDGHGLCLQTGNISRFYADMMKLQLLFQKKRIVAGIYILPTQEVASKIGYNLAYFERFVREIDIFGDIITIPILVIGLS